LEALVQIVSHCPFWVSCDISLQLPPQLNTGLRFKFKVRLSNVGLPVQHLYLQDYADSFLDFFFFP